MRAVVDTNVLISALFWGGVPRRVVDLAAAHVFATVTSADLLAELQVVLIDDFGVPAARAEEVLRDVLSYAEVVAVDVLPRGVVRDKGDEKVLSCALSGRADFIVTGDRDPLVLDRCVNADILTPREFLALLGSRAR